MKPDFAITAEVLKRGFTLVSIDTAHATYQGAPWRALGDFGKRKWENLLVLSRPRERIKILYV